jgi:hypothetical protein
MIQTRKLAAAVVAAAVIAVSLEAVALSAQGRSGRGGGSSSSPSRVISPAVVASWVSHSNYADGRMTTLLVLWRGTPGWFSGSGGSSSSGSSGSASSWGSGQRQSSEYASFSQGGHTFTMEFDYERNIVKMLGQDVSLDATNVVLVDFVDSTTGPVIVGSRWVEPVQVTPPSGDPVAAIIKHAPDLFDYLRCDLSVPDAAMNAMLAMVCGRMRP